MVRSNHTLSLQKDEKNNQMLMIHTISKCIHSVVPPSVLDHFLHLPLDTNELNETYSRMKRGEIIPEIEEGIHRDSAIKLFNVIFNGNWNRTKIENSK